MKSLVDGNAGVREAYKMLLPKYAPRIFRAYLYQEKTLPPVPIPHVKSTTKYLETNDEDEHNSCDEESNSNRDKRNKSSPIDLAAIRKERESRKSHSKEQELIPCQLFYHVITIVARADYSLPPFSIFVCCYFCSINL